jgi:AcrR family transcriptional regulator
MIVRKKQEVHRTNEERTRRMKTWILEATVRSLIANGYAGTSTPEVARHAGVSRGALTHHYRTKEELVLAAVEWLFSQREEEFREAFAKLPAGADRRAAALDLLWKFIGKGDTFHAWLELAVAGRTDPKLGKKVRELGTRTAQEVERTFRELFPRPEPAQPFYQHAPRFAFAVLQGLAINGLLKHETKHETDNVIKMLKLLATMVLDGGAP